MKRKLYNYATLASLLMLCGSLWWWTHSARHTDQVTLHGVGGASLQLTGSAGQVMLTKASHHGDGGQLHWSSAADGGEGKLLATSFSFNRDAHQGMTLILPSWALAAAFAVLPGLWIWSKVHGRGGKKKKSAEAH